MEVTYCCGSKLKGNFRNSKREGICVIKLNTGDYIKAEYKNGVRNGVGYCQFNDYFPFKLISFEGDFENDLKHGYGELLMDNGALYNGEWSFNMQTYGTFEGNGHKYMGFWKGKLMDQKGIYKNPEGKVYRGEIKDGRFVGEGELIDETTIMKGKFENDGDIKEDGRLFTAEFEYEGNIRDGKPHGYGTKVWLKTQQTYAGFW